MLRWRIWRGTVLELGRVLLAKLGHDPYGMLARDDPWRKAIRVTYRIHRDFERGRLHR